MVFDIYTFTYEAFHYPFKCLKLMICHSYIAIEWIVCLGQKYNSLFNPEFRIVTSPAFEDCLEFLAIPQFIRL